MYISNKTERFSYIGESGVCGSRTHNKKLLPDEPAMAAGKWLCNYNSYTIKELGIELLNLSLKQYCMHFYVALVMYSYSNYFEIYIEKHTHTCTRMLTHTTYTHTHACTHTCTNIQLCICIYRHHRMKRLIKLIINLSSIVSNGYIKNIP